MKISKALKKAAEDALAVQDACNLSGVVHSFSRHMTELWKHEFKGLGTDAINTHPVCQLFASKIHDLTNMGVSDLDAYGKAYTACNELVASETIEEPTQ